jgi:hypothetical protein
MTDPICPLCHNPINNDACILNRQGLRFHVGCGDGPMAHPVVLESLHQRITALEGLAHIHSGFASITTSTRTETVSGPAPVAADKPAPSLAAWASGHCPTCHQHKDVIGMPCNDPWHVEQVCAIGHADQPAGDDAAVEHLRFLTWEEEKHNTVKIYKLGIYGACAILAAIRRGEVPGIYAKETGQIGAALAAKDATIADLRTKLAEAQTHGKDMEVMWDRNRNALAARVAELERERDAERELRRMDKEGCDHWCAESERLKADLASEQIAHVNTGARCAALGHTIDAARDECASLHTMIAGKEQQLAAMTERASLSRAVEQESKRIQAESERDAARAEADALRKALAEAQQTLSDFVYMGENWSSLTRPLDQLVGRSRATLETISAAGVTG